jgi:hypothetical protein
MRDEEYNQLSERDKQLVNESYQQYGLAPSQTKQKGVGSLGGRRTLRKKNRKQKTNKRVKKTKKV